MSLQRCVQYRGDFMAEVLLCEPSQFVWVDESGCDRKDYIRKFGYALKGEPPVYHRILHRGKRISAIAAMACDGILGVEGSVGGDEFVDFVRGSLIPEMLPFDGLNCSIHHVQPVTEMFMEAAILVLFLHPYSPDYTPI